MKVINKTDRIIKIGDVRLMPSVETEVSGLAEKELNAKELVKFFEENKLVKLTSKK